VLNQGTATLCECPERSTAALPKRLTERAVLYMRYTRNLVRHDQSQQQPAQHKHAAASAEPAVAQLDICNIDALTLSAETAAKGALNQPLPLLQCCSLAAAMERTVSHTTRSRPLRKYIKQCIGQHMAYRQTCGDCRMASLQRH
jgi:hypothetical protein